MRILSVSFKVGVMLVVKNLETLHSQMNTVMRPLVKH